MCESHFMEIFEGDTSMNQCVETVVIIRDVCHDVDLLT